MNELDVRWKQRLSNFEQSFHLLRESLSIKTPDITQKAGIIQFFEMTFELAWKTLKDYLQEQGFNQILSPRDSFKKAFELGLIEDGHTWIKALDDRNMTTHTYNEIIANEVLILIRNTYFPLLQKLHQKLQSKS